MRDAGRWRPEPPDHDHRGRGLVIIRQLATNVVVDRSPAGTQAGFRLPASAADPAPSPAPTGRARPHTAAPASAELHVHPQPGSGRAWNCAANPPLQLQLTPRSLAYRILTLTGLDNTLPVITDPAG